MRSETFDLKYKNISVYIFIKGLILQNIFAIHFLIMNMFILMVVVIVIIIIDFILFSYYYNIIVGREFSFSFLCKIRKCLEKTLWSDRPISGSFESPETSLAVSAVSGNLCLSKSPMSGNN